MRASQREISFFSTASDNTRLWIVALASAGVAFLLCLGASQVPLFAFALPPADVASRWIFVAAVGIGLSIPAVALLWFWRDPFARTVYASVLAMLAFQIAAETVFSKWFFPAMIIPASLIFISMRISYLALCLSALRGFGAGRPRKVAAAVLGLNLIFCSVVWVHLGVFRLPLILR